MVVLEEFLICKQIDFELQNQDLNFQAAKRLTGSITFVEKNNKERTEALGKANENQEETY